MLFPNREIVATVSRQLGWSRFVKIIPLKDPLKHEFYAEMSQHRTLDHSRFGELLD